MERYIGRDAHAASQTLAVISDKGSSYGRIAEIGEIGRTWVRSFRLSSSSGIGIAGQADPSVARASGDGDETAATPHANRNRRWRSPQSRWLPQSLGAERVEFVGRANEAGFASGRQIQQVSCQNELK